MNFKEDVKLINSHVEYQAYMQSVVDSAKLSIEIITPDQAALFLKKNSLNRDISTKGLSVLIGAFKSLKMRFTGTPIVFDDAGVLIDGQHRLKACVLTSVPFVSLVIRDMPSSTRLYLDQGVRRNLSHQLKILGVKSAINVAAVTKNLFLIDTNHASDYDNISAVSSYAPTMFPYFKLYQKDIIECVRIAQRLCKYTSVLSVAVFATCLCLCRRDNDSEAPGFFESFAKKESSGKYNGVHFMLHNLLFEDSVKEGRHRKIISLQARLFYVLKAYIARNTGDFPPKRVPRRIKFSDIEFPSSKCIIPYDVDGAV